MYVLVKPGEHINDFFVRTPLVFERKEETKDGCSSVLQSAR